MITIAVDAMGGDHGPRVTVPAALSVLKKHPDLALIFVGQREVLEPLLARHEFGSRLQIQHASELVSMDESVAVALRTKKDSSMRVAINLVKEGRAQACVSAGNTGALMATARFVLKTLPGIDRPAIMTSFPMRTGKGARVLDLGANVDSTAEQLYQFAVMGSVVAAAVDNNPSPRVALLNIGKEEIKGNEQVKKTAELLSNNPAINYIGYIEGNAIFRGVADVVVCDGFVGNTMLKACEGISKLIAQYAKEEFQRSWLSKLQALICYPILKRLRARLDTRQYNGATLLGLRGTVIKSHGGADRIAFAYALEEAMVEVHKNIPQLICQQLGSVLDDPDAIESENSNLSES